MDSLQDLSIDISAGPEVTTPPAPPARPASFTLFPQLPAELRIQIWEMSVTPRVLGDRPVSGKLPKLDRNGTAIAIPKGLLEYDNKHDSENPGILHANSESRAVGLKYYEDIAGDNIWPRPKVRTPVYFNHELDTINPLGMLHLENWYFNNGQFPIQYRIDTRCIRRVQVPFQSLYIQHHPYSRTRTVKFDTLPGVLTRMSCIGDGTYRTPPPIPWGWNRRWQLIVADLPCSNRHEIHSPEVQERWRDQIHAILRRVNFPGPTGNRLPVGTSFRELSEEELDQIEPENEDEIPIFQPEIIFQLADQAKTPCVECVALKEWKEGQ